MLINVIVFYLFCMFLDLGDWYGERRIKVLGIRVKGNKFVFLNNILFSKLYFMRFLFILLFIGFGNKGWKEIYYLINMILFIVDFFFNGVF